MTAMMPHIVVYYETLMTMQTSSSRERLRDTCEGSNLYLNFSSAYDLEASFAEHSWIVRASNQ